MQVIPTDGNQKESNATIKVANDFLIHIFARLWLLQTTINITERTMFCQPDDLKDTTMWVLMLFCTFKDVDDTKVESPIA